MKTTNVTKQWGYRAASFWMTLLVAVMIILVGIKFFFAPEKGAADFGIPFQDARDIYFGYIKGIRDIFSGLVLLPLLLLRMKKAAAWVLTTAIIIPLTDCLMVWRLNGTADLPHISIHGLTVVYMLITSYLLFRNKA